MIYQPLRRDWDLEALFSDVRRDEDFDPGNERDEIEARLWADLVAEYDARLLQAELMRRDALEGGPVYSPAFRAFLDAWAKDEAKHTDALLRVYVLSMGEDEASVRARLAERRGDFGPLDRWLDDEFALAVMVAYDEAMSTRAYGEDIPFYRDLGRRVCGSEAFGEALRELKNDEAVHYRNAVELLAHAHGDRGSDVSAVMREVVEFDGQKDEYGGTFLLDLADSQFSPDEMAQVGRAVVAVLERRLGRAGRSESEAC